MIKEKEMKDKWEFVFLGATLDTMQVAQSYGFSMKKSACFSTGKMKETLGVVSQQVSQVRSGKSVEFTQKDRNDIAANS